MTYRKKVDYLEILRGCRDDFIIKGSRHHSALEYGIPILNAVLMVNSDWLFCVIQLGILSWVSQMSQMSFDAGMKFGRANGI